jgi:CapZ-interacting protein
MSILDDAIREHLELKRRHGADDSELKQLEDEAFGPAERPSAEQALPDAAAEAPTEFMTQPPEPAGEEGSRRKPAPGIADLQEAPPQAQPAEEPDSAEEEHPAMEHEAVPEPTADPAPSAGHSTEERHAIAEQPTELYDVEGEIAASQPRSPSDDELVEEEIREPRLAPVDPLAGLEDVDADEVSVADRAQDAAVEAEEEEDDFFDEQRLSEELDQALEAPASAGSAPAALPPLPDLEDEDEEEDLAEEESGEDGLEDEDEDENFEGEEQTAREQDEKDEQPTGDVLGGTPDFLEETPEDDQLWFEQKPPKDFDFDD